MSAIRSAISISAALVALATWAPVASGSGAASGARDDLRSARAAQAGFPTMPVERDPDYITEGSPTPTGVATTLGSDTATVDPGSTTGKRGVAVVRVSCRSSRRTVRCVAQTGRRVVTRCTYRARRTLNRHRTSCRRRADRLLGSTASARAAAVSWQGFPGTTAPAVGALYYQGRKICTATVVDPTLVLTAAHCIWSNGNYLDIRQMRFSPGETYLDANVPGSVQQPFGVWALSNMWVPESYRSGDFSADYALLEIPPLTDGRRISNVVGAHTITPNIRWVPSGRSYLVGYPGVGYWSTRQAFHGRGQYACDSTWSGKYQRDGAGFSIFTDCAMNQGASGGPWFLLVNDQWTIGGVNSRCTSFPGSPPGECSPYAREMLTSYLDNGFLVFWNSVQPLLAYR
jgi:hypothetical protein